MIVSLAHSHIDVERYHRATAKRCRASTESTIGFRHGCPAVTSIIGGA